MSATTFSGRDESAGNIWTDPMENGDKCCVIVILLCVLGLAVFALTGCQTYEVQAGDITLKSNRLLLFDSKTGLNVEVVDANFNSILITLDKSEQNPEDVNVKVNPLLNQYELSTGDIGFEDKNNIELYSGDILHDTAYGDSKKYSIGDWWRVCSKMEDDRMNFSQSTIEKIGNNTDNPELLKDNP